MVLYKEEQPGPNPQETMMQLTASFIEYLVTGSLALLWIVPFCRALRPDIANVFWKEHSPFTI